MSAAASLAYTYRYAFASGVVAEDAGLGLRLATFTQPRLAAASPADKPRLRSRSRINPGAGPGTAENPGAGANPGANPGGANPYFFQGHLVYPREIAEQLLTLADLVHARFFLPNLWRLTDPVVTANDRMLRFEGFSSCCGVYGRVDLKAEAFETRFHGRGTTNVDFNAPMRAALGRIRNQDRVALSVGADALSLAHETGRVVEKKVKLPVRWIKGFTEVQAYQPTLKLRLEIPGSEARQFIRALPRGSGPKQTAWVTPIGRGLRLSMRPSKDAVPVMGTERLRLLENVVGSAQQLRLWSDDGAGVSAWELVLPTGRFLLMLSPELSRGFSGEGQMLTRLAGRHWEEALPRVRSELSWQSRISVADVVQSTGLSTDQTEAALAVLGARGLVGYDLSEGAYFHRELPFDLDAIESLQPRLKDARRLVAAGGVRIAQRQGDGDNLSAIVMVPGTDVEHRVQLLPTGDKCTCPWFSKNQGDRGACKHILAARIVVEGDEESPATAPSAS